MISRDPKIFMCHASEDKERFVKAFAEYLIGKGVDVWLDEWEMKPGDSLVERIFEEGIKGCDVFIIIISKNSINKRWVREELNSAVVQRIENNTKIIPIIIDEDIEIPTSLKYIVWVKIKDLSNYDEELKKIILAIYEVSEKPVLGEKPKFAVEVEKIQGLSKTDSVVLKVIGDYILQKNDIVRFMECSDVIKEASKYEIPKSEIIESLEILESEDFLEIAKISSGVESSFLKMSYHGFIKYCENFLSDFKKKFLSIVSLIINSGLSESKEIASRTKCKLIVVISFLEYFDDYGYIKISEETGILPYIIQINAEGKRYFRGILENNL